MFFNNQEKASKDKYINQLRAIGSLSNLFSESECPYIYYRVMERLFCNAFDAEDLSRSDVSSDAKIKTLGIGLKTFLLGNNKTFQKIAEFNHDRPLYESLKPREKIIRICSLRNRRLELTEDLHGLTNAIYHCLLRDKEKLLLYEEAMDKIDVSKIRNIISRSNTISFEDNHHEYSFSLSKSTLMKRFITYTPIFEFEVKIIKDPIELLTRILNELKDEQQSKSHIIETIYLPLYGRNRTVYEKSGLNQWNAGGRARHPNEVYIIIPKKIHEISPNFFPNREKHFNLKLPSGVSISAKVCQANSKALMSQKNKELGEWILRKVLKLPEDKIVTYEMLQEIGIDSVRIDKIDNENYEINFASINSYEDYIENSIS